MESETSDLQFAHRNDKVIRKATTAFWSAAGNILNADFSLIQNVLGYIR
jgi:hypothetical protein